ncbi:MAG: DUF1749 domain-containing protein [Parcubacteria group bacterium]|nr:DUF1749 domain-containing protein [Parcubacteria group bacterium]
MKPSKTIKKQIVIIQGGHPLNFHENFLSVLKKKKVTADSFKLGYGWKEDLHKKLKRQFEIFFPKMPNRENATYAEWKIWFEKLIPFLKNDVILVGHSLGGLFLIKYLSEKRFPKKIEGLFIVAAPFVNNKKILGKNFLLKDNLKKVIEQAKTIFIYHSKDDTVVPFNHVNEYLKKLPTAHVRIFKNKGHFNQRTFPEIVRDIKNIF